MITINVNDIFDKMIGNENEIIIKRENKADDLILITAKKYNEILRRKIGGCCKLTKSKK